MSGIRLEELSKRFERGTAAAALDGLNLAIGDGERMVVLGPSGSGKSTLLRLIAGLEQPTSGLVAIGGTNQAGVPPHRRGLAMVFQNPALYPHLSVFDNLAFGLRARGVGRSELKRRVGEAAELLGLSALLERRPRAISGGERQRVAIGRAIAWRPPVLLMDEPFSSLDPPLRASLREQVLALHRQLGMTLVHVTHDQSEALLLGQRIALLRSGRLLQVGPPREIYDRPVDRFCATFVGSPAMNLIPCHLARATDPSSSGLVAIRPVSGSFCWQLAADSPSLPRCLIPADGIRLDLGLRPEAIRVVPDAAGGGDSSEAAGASRAGHLRATAGLQRVEFHGFERIGVFDLAGQSLVARLPAVGPGEIEEGARAVLEARLDGCSWFDPKTGHALS
jgi:ABC-type sugar transport system ATPase subunit